ncbi:MAG: hypothetical protein BWX94_00416 [Tenericutes bacterium ADurb.Bin140]|nr:MAG: hypothetical protein BWX94_00416 [Tenericutes bacterium ADurb.Bin140]
MAFQSVQSFLDDGDNETEFVLQPDFTGIDIDVKHVERKFDKGLAFVLQVVEVLDSFENRNDSFGLAREDEVFGIEVIQSVEVN